MATPNSGLVFFSSVAAMVPVSQADANRTVVKPVDTALSQTKKAAQFGKNPATLLAVAELEKCANALNAAMNLSNATATSSVGATGAKQDEAHQDAVSTPSFRR